MHQAAHASFNEVRSVNLNRARPSFNSFNAIKTFIGLYIVLVTSWLCESKATTRAWLINNFVDTNSKLSTETEREERKRERERCFGALPVLVIHEHP